MDFGQTGLLPEIDWKIPENRCDFQATTGKFKLYVGCPMWANKDWLGRLYPRGTPPAKFFEIYSRNFNSIEYNGSFYHLPSEEQVDRWLSKMSDGFLFCPKFPKAISHQSHGRELIDEAVQRFSQFGSQLGLCFLQFPPTLSIQQGLIVKKIIEQIDKRLPVAVEFRHPSWFENGQINPKVYSYLRENNTATVITDTPGRRDVLHSCIPANNVMVRFLSSGNDEVDSKRLRQWCQRIALWKDLGIKSVYFFTHKSDNIKSPELASQFIQMFNSEDPGSIELPDLTGGEKQTSLFG